MIYHICRNVVLLPVQYYTKNYIVSIIVHVYQSSYIKKIIIKNIYIYIYINIYTLIMAAINMCDQKSVSMLSELIINGKT